MDVFLLFDRALEEVRDEKYHLMWQIRVLEAEKERLSNQMLAMHEKLGKIKTRLEDHNLAWRGIYMDKDGRRDPLRGDLEKDDFRMEQLAYELVMNTVLIWQADGKMGNKPVWWDLYLDMLEWLPLWQFSQSFETAVLSQRIFWVAAELNPDFKELVKVKNDPNALLFTGERVINDKVQQMAQSLKSVTR